MSTLTLSYRDRALLIAAGEGRCELVSNAVPDLRVDGRWFCDQPRAHAGPAGAGDRRVRPGRARHAGHATEFGYAEAVPALGVQ